MVNKGRPTEIASQRELEKEFANIEKLFIGKETESNWEGRDASVKNLRSLLQSNNLEEHKDYFVQGLHNVMSGLIKSIHSLRTSVALEGLSLIADISQVLGEALDQYTMETILSNLLKCSSVTKKLIVTKSGQVTNTFLSHTPFYTKMMVMLCKTVSEKNVQIRQLSSNYLKTLLETHGSKEFVRAAIEKADALLLLDQFLKKGLIDAAPAIRDSCRSLYWAYQQLWEDRAEKLCKSLDATTQRQIEKSKSGTSTTKLAPRALNSRSNSASSLPSLLSRSSSSTSTTKSKISPIPSPSLSSRTAANKDTSKDTSTNTFKKPALKRSASAHAATTPPVKPISRPIPATSSEVRRNLNAQKMSRLSHISNASAPSATIQHKLKSSAAIATTTATTRRSQSEFHQQSVLASASLLHMLKSNDTHMKCKGIRLLSERLKKTRYSPSSFDTILPPDVPTKIDLLPILMDTLSRTDWDNEVYQMLMSWESLAGIFVYVMSVNYYCPTLVIANEEEAKSTEMIRLYSKGLSRVKMFLKRNDAQLPQRLLDLLKSVMTDQNLLDSSVKRDMQLFPLYRTYLQRGLLIWMDELVCDYIGIPEDEDAEMLMEGSAWLHVSKEDSTIAGQWFDVNDHVQFYIEFVLKTLLKEDKKSKLYPRLCDLGGHLKMANQKVFEKELNKLDKKESTCIEKALGLLAAEDDFFLVKSVETVQTIVDDICSEQPLMIDSEMIEADNDQTTDSCGLTQPISNIEIKPQTTGTVEERTETEKKEEVVVEPLSTKVPDQSINNSAKVNPIIKHNFARPAPVARRISLEADYSISNKKRRKGNHDDGEPVVAVESVKSMAVLNFLSSKDEALLPKLQEISDAMSTQQGEEKNMQFWSRDMPVNSNVLFSLLDTVSQSLINSRDSVRSHAVVLINKLLDNQKEVFLFSKSSAYSKTIFNLSKALIITNVDVYDNISGTADKAIESIFLHICSIELALKTLWNLSKDEEFVHPKKTFSTHPLGTLFMYISKLAPKETCSNLENSLKNGAAETLVQGHNHSNVSVRKSCLQATIGIHKVLGDSYIHTYLSMLRTKILNIMVRNNPSLMGGSFSLLVHNPKILEFDNKRSYFVQQLHKRTEPREHYPPLQLNVRRAHVFEDTYRQLQGRTGKEIKHGKLNVQFHNEEGVDAGGVAREWFSVLARQMFDPNYALFITSAADKLTYQPNRASGVNSDHLSYFKCVGRIIGKAIHDGRLLDAYFTRSFYKLMLGRSVDYRDVEAVDPAYYKSLVWMLDNDITDIIDLTFSVETDDFGTNKIIDLKPDGRNIAVTESNKHEYVTLITEQKLVLAIKDQVNAFLEGFHDIIPAQLIQIFNEQELELLISGLPDIDIDEWKANTVYEGYTLSSPQIQWFWRAVRSFDQEERAKLLQFSTGTSKVPLEGFSQLQGSNGVQKFQIHKEFGDVNRLPSAHTCFNQIDLPQYLSYEDLRSNLFKAISECSTGFAFQ